MIAPSGWRAIDFISDLHLSESTPEAFAIWSTYLVETPADAVLILGDLFDVWVGDDAASEGFEARVAEVLRRAAARRYLGFMAGNRDFLVGASFLGSIGVAALDDPTVIEAFGERVVATHGDAWCTSDVAYQRFRSVVRDRRLQRAFLALPLSVRRRLAKRMRGASEERHARSQDRARFDVESSLAVDAMARANACHLVHGHTHRPCDEALSKTGFRHVLSDWDYGPTRTPRGDVLRWRADGIRRLAPLDAIRELDP